VGGGGCCCVITFLLFQSPTVAVVVTVRFKTYVCGRLVAGIAGSNPAVGTYIRCVFVVCWVVSGLCEEVITRPGESYLKCVCLCLCLCNIQTQKRGGLDPYSAVVPQKNNTLYRIAKLKIFCKHPVY
jgi:hypothetical protein